MNKHQVLLIEDEQAIQDCFRPALERLGCEVVAVQNGLDAKQVFAEKSFDFILTDWMMPKMSGLEFTSWVRNEKKSMVPILMITARDTPDDIVAGLDAGVDDYLPKPLQTKVLDARVKAVIRRLQNSLVRTEDANLNNKTILSKDNLSLNTETLEVVLEGQPVILTNYEFKILKTMLENQGKALSRKQLMTIIQEQEVKSPGRAIDTHVFTLRKKLGNYGQELIESIRSVGYRIKA